MDDTIVAVATGQGGGLRAIIRIAGPESVNCLSQCFQQDRGSDHAPCQIDSAKTATIFSGTLQLSDLNRLLPCDLYLWPDERSYTRTPMAEIHMVGSPPLAAAVVRTLCQCGARLAEPGEFTLRAFLGGRIDLTQAEAVLGVIDSRGQQQLQTALQQMAGGISGPLNRLRDQLLDLLAHIEAGLDFVEEDIEFISQHELLRQLDDTRRQVSRLSEQMRTRSETTTSIRAVLCGAPNVGKSSLFNALAGRPAAIISDTPGTTRDYLMAEIDLDGATCELVDTAGDELADAGTISAAAQAATTEQRSMAEIRLLCVDSTQPFNDRERTLLEDVNPLQPSVLIWTKCDYPRSSETAIAKQNVVAKLTTFEKSLAVTGSGIDALRAALRTLIVDHSSTDCQVVASTANRCRESLRHAADHLDSARQSVECSTGEEITAADVRTALDELGQVVGAVYTDDILDRVFSRFCIGK